MVLGRRPYGENLFKRMLTPEETLNYPECEGE